MVLQYFTNGAGMLPILLIASLKRLVMLVLVADLLTLTKKL